MLRIESDQDERHASWLELFYDLAFVAVIGQMSTRLVQSHSLEDIGRFAVFFIPVWWAWVGQAFYLSRFDADDLSHRLFSFLQIIILGAMGIGVSRALQGDTNLFILTYIAMRTVLVVQYKLVSHNIPRARPLANQYAIGFTMAICVWIASLFVPPALQPVLWLVGIMFDFLTPNLANKTALYIPPHPGHIPERFGLFTIIVLGEAVIATVATLAGQTGQHVYPALGVLGLLLAFGIWWVYFDGAKGAEARLPDPKDRGAMYRLWMYSHLPLHMTIVLLALGVERAMVLGPKPFPGYESWLFPLAFLVLMLLMHALFNSAILKADRRANAKFIRPYWYVTLSGIPLVFLSPFLPAGVVLSLMVLLTTTHVVLGLREAPAELAYPAKQVAEMYRFHGARIKSS